MTYKAKVKKFPLSKTYLCKGHQMMPVGTLLILASEERVFIPSRYIIEFDDGWFKMECQKVKDESGGKADIAKNSDT